VSAAARPVGGIIAVATALLTTLAWSAFTSTRAHGAAVRENIHASLTTQQKPAAQSAPTCDPTASLRPVGPPTVSPGSYMATIRARGYLIAGVDQNTYHFGYLNPFNGQIEGFDIDMLHAIAAAIFGNPDKIRFVAISDAERIPAIQSGKVDIVAHTMTITCASRSYCAHLSLAELYAHCRTELVDFSTVYFDAAQRVLVLKNSGIHSLLNLTSRKICATPTSTSLANIKSGLGLDASEKVFGTAVAAPGWTDCLVLLQQGEVAAISTDDSILAGLQAQDPYTEIIGPRLSNEPYGLAISKQHPDFVRFVNAVLAKMRADGQWAASYKRWIGTPAPAPPPAHYLG
jgi:polar amino acid transport system substrate-binding protein